MLDFEIWISYETNYLSRVSDELFYLYNSGRENLKNIKIIILFVCLFIFFSCLYFENFSTKILYVVL